MLYIFPCSVSLPSQSVQLFFIYFCFQSNIKIIIHTSLCHCNCLLCLTPLFFVYLFSILISCFVPCFHCLFLFFVLSLTSSFHHHVSLSPFLFPNVTLSTVSAVFLSISVVLFHSSGNSSLPPKNLDHLLSKRFLTACLSQFPRLYLWLYFLCFFLFHHKGHFANHHTVLLFNALICYYLAITHFLQVLSSAHHMIYLGTFSDFFLQISIFLLK